MREQKRTKHNRTNTQTHKQIIIPARKIMLATLSVILYQTSANVCVLEGDIESNFVSYSEPASPKTGSDYERGQIEYLSHYSSVSR